MPKAQPTHADSAQERCLPSDCAVAGRFRREAKDSASVPDAARGRRPGALVKRMIYLIYIHIRTHTHTFIH